MLGLATRGARAADAIWNGGAGNWNSGGWTSLPDEQTDAKIDGGKTGVQSTVTADSLSYTRDFLLDADDSLRIASSGALYVDGNAILNGNVQVDTATMSGHSSGFIDFRNNAAALLGGSGSIAIGSSTSYGDGGIFNGNSAPLTIGQDLSIHGVGYIFGVNAGIVNLGTISADVPGKILALQYVTSKGILEAKTGARLDLSGGDNYGLIRVDGGLTLLQSLASAAGETFSNNYGVIDVTSGGELKLARGVNGPDGVINVDGATLTMRSAQWKNQGTITLHDSVFNIQDQMSTGDLGNISRSGTGLTILSDRLVNTGQVLTLSGPSDNWLLQFGTIQGGMVTASGGAQLTSMDGTLDGVTLNTSIGLVASTATSDLGDRKVTVKNGLSLNNGMIELNADANHAASLVFTGEAAQTFSGDGEIRFGAVGTNAVTIVHETAYIPQVGPVTFPVGDVTIGPGIVIHGAVGSIGVGTDAHFVNQGTISADVNGGVISVANVTNNGRIEAKSGASINLGTGFSQVTGTLEVDGSVASAIPLSLGGTTTGGGTISAWTRIEGLLAPGSDDGQEPGTLSIIGDLSLGSNGRLNIQLGSVSDLLKVTGNLDLSSQGDALMLSQLGSVEPGSEFIIATYTGDLSGVFDTVSPGYLVSYTTPHEVIVTAVPEANGSIVLLALAILHTKRRRRRPDRN
jgi:hypothetical protein